MDFAKNSILVKMAISERKSSTFDNFFGCLTTDAPLMSQVINHSQYSQAVWLTYNAVKA